MKIGNGGGFWGDDLEGPLRLVQGVPDLDYLTLDYLAELSLSIMAAQKQKNPLLGYASDFIEVVESLLGEWEKGASFKIVTNAGGLNPEGLKKELEKRVKGKKVVALSGDDVLSLLKNSPENPLFCHLETGAPLSEVVDKLVTAHAYLGAGAIVKALQEGADIIVTGRVADPSLVVGPALYHFGWNPEDYQKIAQATVAGHLIECGTQVTGGISTTWEGNREPWKLGFPYIEMEESGEFVVTQPENSSGEVSLVTVKEQLLYEIGDPAHYLSPDATVSFLGLKLEEVGKNRVKVTGALGSAPPPAYKVSATWRAGFRAEGTLLFVGDRAPHKARRGAEVILKRAPVKNSLIEVYGEGDEALLRLAASDVTPKPLEKFIRQFAPLVTCGPPGTTGYTGGKGKVRPLFGYWPCLIERSQIDG